MSTHEKLLARMRNNRLDWRNEGGSHHVFSYPGVDDDVCIPARRPIKPVYVRLFLALVDKAKELQS